MRKVLTYKQRKDRARRQAKKIVKAIREAEIIHENGREVKRISGIFKLMQAFPEGGLVDPLKNSI